ncbi:MAG: hypothetical protein HY561_09275 [Gemmatimonadetes bacterium]|nr:hypothetical protein [Gemmatimonadota bacterium]
MRRGVWLLVVAALAGAGAGCAGALAGYDVAPSGLTRPDDAVRSLLAAERYESALERLTPERAPTLEDELLRSLYRGIVAHYAGQYQESGGALERAATLAEDRYTRSLSREAASFLTSERVLPYQPAATERLFIHYYAALNYLKQENPVEAAVEARRLSQLLARLEEGGHAQEQRPLHLFLRTFAGAVFEAAGERTDAEVAYRHARALAESAGVPDSTLPLAADTAPLSDGTGEVIVLLEQGFVAHRVEQSLIIVLGSGELGVFESDDDERRTHAARGLATHALGEILRASVAADAGGRPRTIFIASAVQSKASADTGTSKAACAGCGGGKKATDDDDEDDDSYLLRVAWPVYVRDWLPSPGAATVAAGETSVRARVLADLSRAVVRDFEAERTELLARTIARAAAKFALTRGVEEQAGKKNEALGKILGLLTNAGTAILEQADTRSWHLLPSQVAVARLRLPAGSHALVLQVSNRAGEVRKLDLGTVEVRPGTVAFVSTRSWR